MLKVRELSRSILASAYHAFFTLLVWLLEKVEAEELDWLLDFLNGEKEIPG